MVLPCHIQITQSASGTNKFRAYFSAFGPKLNLLKMPKLNLKTPKLNLKMLILNLKMLKLNSLWKLKNSHISEIFSPVRKILFWNLVKYLKIKCKISLKSKKNYEYVEEKLINSICKYKNSIWTCKNSKNRASRRVDLPG